MAYFFLKTRFQYLDFKKQSMAKRTIDSTRMNYAYRRLWARQFGDQSRSNKLALYKISYML